MQQISPSDVKTISTSSSQIIDPLNGTSFKRTQVIFINTSASAIITLNKGDSPAIAGSGIILQPNGSYSESSDSAFKCWQGAWQAIGNGAGTLSIVEQKEMI